MREHFERHESHFDQLAAMSNADFNRTNVTRVAFGFTRLADDWGWPRSSDRIGISPARWEEYRELFQRLELRRHRPGRREPRVHSIYGLRSGMAGEGIDRGYLWNPSTPTPINDRRQSFAVKPLKGHWYLYMWEVR
jgi:hypothetical protein